MATLIESRSIDRDKPGVQTMFYAMSDRELQSWIAGCHERKEYGSEFKSACRERNERLDYLAICGHMESVQHFGEACKIEQLL